MGLCTILNDDKVTRAELEKVLQRRHSLLPGRRPTAGQDLFTGDSSRSGRGRQGRPGEVAAGAVRVRATPAVVAAVGRKVVVLSSAEPSARPTARSRPNQSIGSISVATSLDAGGSTTTRG